MGWILGITRPTPPMEHQTSSTAGDSSHRHDGTEHGDQPSPSHHEVCQCEFASGVPTALPSLALAQVAPIRDAPPQPRSVAIPATPYRFPPAIGPPALG